MTESRPTLLLITTDELNREVKCEPHNINL